MNIAILLMSKTLSTLSNIQNTWKIIEYKKGLNEWKSAPTSDK